MGRVPGEWAETKSCVCVCLVIKLSRISSNYQTHGLFNWIILDMLPHGWPRQGIQATDNSANLSRWDRKKDSPSSTLQPNSLCTWRRWPAGIASCKHIHCPLPTASPGRVHKLHTQPGRRQTCHCSSHTDATPNAKPAFHWSKFQI